MKTVKIDRLLGNLGYGTRKEAQRIVKSGRVTVDGEVVTDPARGVDPESVTLDGESLDAPLGLVVAVHKPVGYVCSHSDREGPRVFDLLPEQWMQRNPRPSTVGRLDKDSSGLVLVTDSGALVHALTSPRRHVAKRYVVTLDRMPGDDLARLVERFASGELWLRGDETPCRPAVLEPLDDSRFVVLITEGRHRQVRRMFANLGYEVASLLRTHVGEYALDDLPEGEWRFADSDTPASASDDRHELLRYLYDAHSRRDIDAALAFFTDDVEWPNVAEGTVLHGHDAVRAYWTTQFATIDPHVEPVAFTTNGDQVAVTVHQVVRDMAGVVLRDSTVMHTYTFRDGLVAAMRVDDV